ncbi:glycosyltransferase involved in cell wall biosynthesis [Hasllibacter halocynthiae]|uniref:Glycosyltransferase involved in cell wall biosynthesis n=1 Tax=Hasllibacter halocynthiae TaxID=595589 RepID=A0A2T0X944_9RHOB|nr:glycosyltransferase [Hasllibacter halocynthiae]PRY95466.1 glycosyltransferase involved in cell wall biosynthesis [Hasllibacter halocynthiae]
MTRRVLLTTDCVGGVWRFSATLGEGLARLGWAPALATIGPVPSMAQRREVAGIALFQTEGPLDWAEGGAAGLAAGRAALRAAAREHGAEAVILNQPAFGGAEWDRPVVAVAHSSVATWWRGVRGAPEPAGWRWHGAAVREGIRAAGAAVAPTRAFAASLAAAHDLRARPEAIPNGAPLPQRAPGAGEGFVLAAGRLWDEGKGMAVLDRAARGLGWPVRVAGADAAPGGGRAAFEHLRPAGTLGAAAMAGCMGEAGIFAAPSLYEPFGLAVLEAAGLARPLVLSDIPPFRELWDGAALFHPPGDAEALHAALAGLIGDPGARARLGAAARARAAALTPDRQAAAYDALLRRIAPARRGAA